MPGGLRRWLIWSWRDLRARWMVVAATGLVIAMGTGVYASLGNQRGWRRSSLNASYAKANAHDVRLTLGEGDYAPAGSLAAAVRALRRHAGAQRVEERLVAPTQVDASSGGRTVLVPGRIVGIPPDSRIDLISVNGGRALSAADAGSPVAVLEQHFAKVYGLPATGSVSIGGTRLHYVGRGMTPDYFIVTSAAGWGAESSLAVVFLPLATAQRLSGHAGVNELVARLAPGANARAFGQQASAAIRRALPGTGVTVTLLADEDAHRTLYRDARNDQKIFDVYAYLLLAGAAFVAFNLVSRVVEAQRREIGIGMALGVPPRALALRPFLLGAEVALLGVVFGVGVGIGFGELLKMLMADQLPLPRYTSPFSLQMFAVAAALGFVLPLVATAVAVRRGVALTPVEAIRGARTEAGGLAPLLRRVPLPGRTLAQMPLRNVLRTPRRTLLTVLGIGAVLTALVSLGGMIDSMRATVNESEQQTRSTSPERLSVTLTGLVPRDSAAIKQVAANPAVGAAAPEIAVPAELAGRKRIELSLEVLDAGSPVWHPAVSHGSFRPGQPGIVISSRAARQLRVHVGDTVVLRHPRVSAAGRVDVVDSRVRVAALHSNPFRFLAYMDESQAGLMNMTGLANAMTVVPAPGKTQAAVERALFGRPGVAAVQPASSLTDAAQKAIDEFLSAIILTEGIVLLLALLVAFNSSSISADERRRESATMFAFGVPVRSAALLAVLENLVIGLLATGLGLALGYLVTRWVVSSLMPQTFPELGAQMALSVGTLLMVVLAGVVAVGLAPLLTVRRLRRMSVPSTLRVVE
ncbi:MAG TPA: ABC transporter permease [Thermoleophilaceae bacterium]